MEDWQLEAHQHYRFRILITFSLIACLCIIVYWVNKWIKTRNFKRRNQSEGSSEPGISSNIIELKSNGVYYVYIAYWRYVMLAIVFSIPICIDMPFVVDMWRNLKTDFIKHWDKETTFTVLMSLILLRIIFYIPKIFKIGYKAVQFEVGKDYVRFRKSVGRGGILFSDTYIVLKFNEITRIEFQEAPIIGYRLTIKTAAESYPVALMLSAQERHACYRLLDKATEGTQLNTI